MSVLVCFSMSRQLIQQIRNVVDEKLVHLSQIAQEGLERAKSFSLNKPRVVVAQDAFAGRMSMLSFVEKTPVWDTRLGQSLDNLSSTAKSVEDRAIQRLKSRNTFFATKDEWFSAMKENDISLKPVVHSVEEITTQQGIIRHVDDGSIGLVTNMSKGNYGEMTTDEIYRQLWYDRISLDMTTEIDGVTHRGIDGVYYNPDGHSPYIIAEAKYGGSRLSYLKDGTKQMDSNWISKRLRNAVGDEQALKIASEFRKGKVGR